MADYILAIDQGTTSSRAMIFDLKGQVVAIDQQEFKQSFPHEGWVEHDPEEIWQSVCHVVKGALAKASLQASDIRGLGITNQRETTVLWDQETGQSVYPAIVWQDRRTADHCKTLKAKSIGQEDADAVVKQKTGLLIDPYFSATKMNWILENVPQAKALLQKQQLRAGTIDSYLIWKLTNGQSHVTDATNACRTNLFNIHTQEWDEELCDFFQVPSDILPEVKDCAADFGVCDESHFGAALPIAGVAGDQHAALIGQACFKEGMSKCTYGTGCFLNINTGNKPIFSEHGLITTLGYRINGKVTYAMEGSAFIAGAVIQWLRDGLELFKSAKDSKAMAEQARDQQVFFVPAFTGLGAPYWDPNARGAIFGLTRDTGKNEIVSAALESVCFQTMDLLAAMQQDGAEFTALRVDGGMTNNDLAMQMMADIAQTKVLRPAMTETTALGAAYLTGLQLGVWSSLEEIAELWAQDRAFEVAKDKDWSLQRYQRWQAAVKACQVFSGA